MTLTMPITAGRSPQTDDQANIATQDIGLPCRPWSTHLAVGGMSEFRRFWSLFATNNAGSGCYKRFPG